MDVNQDGHLDILSGSYSRTEPDTSMAGLFQVMLGDGNGGFAKPTALAGKDGEPLIITTDDSEAAVIRKICTRPFAADLDADGDLDIVAGNFEGTFAFFAGEGAGRFAATSTWLMAGDEPVRVDAHSDPFLVDWDGDGDLDLISGASSGAVHLCVNEGTKAAPAFAEPIELLATKRAADDESNFVSESDLRGPAGSTRVWVADVDGDGKLDLLVGDSMTLRAPAEGVAAEAALAQLRTWTEELEKLSSEFDRTEQMTEEQSVELGKRYSAHYERRASFLHEERTGYIWLVRQL